MAHNLEMNADGTANMAYTISGGLPWHGLGNPVSDNMTPEQMMKAAGADWNVREANTYAELKINGERHRVPTGQKALIRETDASYLTQVGKNWKPVQNSEAFDFFTDFVSKGDMSMETAGVLDDGRIVWAMAKINGGDFSILNGDEMRGYLLFTNPHMYGKTINIRQTYVRTVCQNTLNLALNTKSKAAVSVNHRRAFDADAVKEILGLSEQNRLSFQEQAEKLAKAQYDRDKLVKYFGDIFGESKKEDKKLGRIAEQAMDVVETQPGANFAPGSMWNAFNAVTYLIDHKLGRSNDTRMQSAWYGINANKKTKALETALQMAEAA